MPVGHCQIGKQRLKAEDTIYRSVAREDNLTFGISYSKTGHLAVGHLPRSPESQMKTSRGSNKVSVEFEVKPMKRAFAGRPASPVKALKL